MFGQTRPEATKRKWRRDLGRSMLVFAVSMGAGYLLVYLPLFVAGMFFR